MDIRQTLKEYDSLFRKATPDEIHAFLAEHIRQAEEEDDKGALLTLLNEQIGYARDTDRAKVAIGSSEKLLGLVREMGLEGTLPYGNSLLNIANAYRMAGMYEESSDMFYEVEKTYQVALEDGDYAYAGLYNNWSLLAMAQHQYDAAIHHIRKAIRVIDRYDRAAIKQATSRVNLALALNALYEESRLDSLRDEARRALDQAIDIFERDGGQDYHYASALAALADMQYAEGDYEDAARGYDRAIRIIQMYMGNNSAARMLAEKKERALRKAELYD